MPSSVATDSLLDLVTRISRRLTGRHGPDYRELLFQDLRAKLAGKRPLRILEIGPKDGEDTKRLLTLNPDILVLVDLPDKEVQVRQWLAKLAAPNIELIIANIMYDEGCAALEPFDVVWCTGVLYHNPEQLRMIKRLFDFTRRSGVLVIESATARRRHLRDENCIEIWYGVPKATHSAHHVSMNVTHLPSRRAIQSWLGMVGFEDVQSSDCLRRVLRKLGRDRAAFVAKRPEHHVKAAYYSLVGLDYEIGKAR
jgi:SAM-dependent methyltransferase